MAALLFLPFARIVIIVVSAIYDAPPPAEKTEDLVWTRDLLRTIGAVPEGTPWYRNYKITLASSYSIVTFGVVAMFA